MILQTCLTWKTETGRLGSVGGHNKTVQLSAVQVCFRNTPHPTPTFTAECFWVQEQHFWKDLFTVYCMPDKSSHTFMLHSLAAAHFKLLFHWVGHLYLNRLKLKIFFLQSFTNVTLWIVWCLIKTRFHSHCLITRRTDPRMENKWWVSDTWHSQTNGCSVNKLPAALLLAEGE